MTTAIPEFVLVLTTLPTDLDGATAFARQLVEERLAACVNVLGEMRSIYTWQGRVEDEPERQIVVKTTRGRLEALWGRVQQLHPYEVPEFLVLPIVDGSAAYLRWVTQSTAPEGAPEGSEHDTDGEVEPDR